VAQLQTARFEHGPALLIKQIAGQLVTSERTIKFHRAHIMQKMRAESLADLVRMAQKLGLTGQP
jgi:FixJ family two-component response regulator